MSDRQHAEGVRSEKLVLGVSGSLREQSVNTAILKAMRNLAPEGIRFELFEGLDRLPYFSTDLDQDTLPEPEAVGRWRGRLRQADAVVLCTPEFAAGVPGVLKNALEWTVSSAEFMNKPTAVISASPTQTGGDKAHASLLLTLGMLMADMPEAGKLTIPLAGKYVNESKEVSDPVLLDRLRAVLDAVVRP
ncbi:NADPH-dependent FMN reductase [Cohnella zeiphila]|uniref:NAD(P)H-dependent oxidoreductase n=1 Tax=Cohnella zeiphila TaxID=2761120 RepID=A0A7X0VYB2_9BACL|nr:NADPH-dependent FMN reductase [Cohnella zeiphila]MBB6735189.1 NAD(P)H-dependent oxidoreductase [Cohnella zeiphila]